MAAPRPRLHYAWIVAGLIFVCLMASAGIRSAPGVLIVPLEQSFGWSRATVSSAVSIGILLYGLVGPFAAACMQRFGIRRTILGGLSLLLVAVTASTRMQAVWQLMLTWGLMVGIGCGSLAVVLAAAIVNRWFVARRGLVMGLLTASTATGQLIFLPLYAALTEAYGWQAVAWAIAGVLALAIPLVLWLLPESPEAVGLKAYGAPADYRPAAASRANPIVTAFGTLGRATGRRDFWLLFASFFVCGLSTNGLIGTHLIASCIDNGLPAMRGASLLALIGACDMVGTVASGWLSDRYDNRLLLFFYYGLRGLSLLYLPYSGFDTTGLALFAVFYGLDWVATVPPTARLTTQLFGAADGPVVFGWVFAGHMLGAAAAASGAGLMRELMGTYNTAFLIAGAICGIAALMVLTIPRQAAPTPGARLATQH
ncbi:MAG: MFS transporter [Nevskia sp.]